MAALPLTTAFRRIGRLNLSHPSFGKAIAPTVHSALVGAACGLQQVRHGPKDGRPGRLQHHIFGCDKPKGRFYYRFHKLIGKWNWRKYTERFIAPRALENRQRLIPSSHASYTQMRQSYSWWWRLPKAIAAATTPEEVLEAWVQFRHKHPKRTYHYFKVLKRLVDVGGCDATDWRLKLITSRLSEMHRKVLNKPRLAKYYAQLRVTDELENLARFLPDMMPKYSPQQLVLTVHAFGLARLQDRRVFIDCARLVEPDLAVLSPSDLIRLAQAFASVDLCHYTLMGRISAQLQVRVQQAVEGESPFFSCPTFSHLVDAAEAFARLKYQDYSFSEMCAQQAESLLISGEQGPSPPALGRLCTALAKLKMHEVRLFEVVLAHIRKHWYDYPACALAEIGSSVSPVMPQELDHIQESYKVMVGAIAADRDTLTLKDIANAAKFMAEVDRKSDFATGLAPALAKRIVDLRDETKERYDIARVIEIFGKRTPEDRALFSCLNRHIHRHLLVFEPVDFVRCARGLVLTEYRDDRVAHALSKWAAKRAAEFSTHDWDRLASALATLKGKGGAKLETKLKEISPPRPVVIGESRTSSAAVQPSA